MRETRLYGSEGGVARKRHPYPYRKPAVSRRSHSAFRKEVRSAGIMPALPLLRLRGCPPPFGCPKPAVSRRALDFGGSGRGMNGYSLGICFN